VSRCVSNIKILVIEMKNLESELEMSEITSDELFYLSKKSFNDIWGGAENDHWDEFLKPSTPKT
jgi:hypothetical protein